MGDVSGDVDVDVDVDQDGPHDDYDVPILGDKDEDEDESALQRAFSCEFTFCNKWFQFFVTGFSFVAWLTWYKLATGGGKKMELQELLIFTSLLLLGLLVLCLIHSKKTKDANALIAAHDYKATPTNVAMALFEKTYGNLTDAIGYVLVEAWTATYPIDEIGTHEFIVASIRFVVFLALVTAIELCQQKMKKGVGKDAVDCLATVLASGASFAVAFPLVNGWKNATDTPMGDACVVPPCEAPYWAGFLALAIGVAVTLAAKLLTARICHADGKEQDTDDFEAVVGEKGLVLVTNVSFYTAALLLKKTMLADFTDIDAKWGMWLVVIAFSFFAVLMGVVLEYLQDLVHVLPLDKAQAAYWNKFRQDLITAYMRVMGMVFSGLFLALVNAYVSFSRDSKGWLSIGVALALGAQVFALVMDELRARFLKKFISSQDDFIEDELGIDLDSVDADELEDNFEADDYAIDYDGDGDVDEEDKMG